MGTTDKVVLYRADIKGLGPGGETSRMVAWFDSREYTFATTSLDVARAFGVYAFGVPRDHERSVYRVELDYPIFPDPDFRSDVHVSFVLSHWGTVLEVVEENVTLTADEARKIMSAHARWVDDSPIYDDAGYATAPPKWSEDTRYDAEEVGVELRKLGAYPNPRAVLQFLNARFP